MLQLRGVVFDEGDLSERPISKEFASILQPNRTELDLLHKCHAPKVRLQATGVPRRPLRAPVRAV